VKLRVALVVWSLVAFAAVDLGGPAVLTFLVVFGYCTVAPGLALLGPASLRPGPATAVAVLGASVSLAAIVTLPLLYLGEYDATLVMALLASSTIAIVMCSPVVARGSGVP
jgi:hypothetical protein